MRLLGFLCNIGVHRWRGDIESLAKRYRHNTWWDKTKNHLGSPRALTQTCICCGKRRKWSFNRGKWRGHHDQGQAVDTSAAWRESSTVSQSDS